MRVRAVRGTSHPAGADEHDLSHLELDLTDAWLRSRSRLGSTGPRAVGSRLLESPGRRGARRRDSRPLATGTTRRGTLDSPSGPAAAHGTSRVARGHQQVGKRPAILRLLEHRPRNETGYCISRAPSAGRSRARACRCDRAGELSAASWWAPTARGLGAHDGLLRLRPEIAEMRSTVPKNCTSTLRMGTGVRSRVSTNASRSRMPRLSMSPVSKSGVDASTARPASSNPRFAVARHGPVDEVDQRVGERVRESTGQRRQRVTHGPACARRSASSRVARVAERR